MTHLRSMLALRLCARATAAIDTPGRMHSAINAALNSEFHVFAKVKRTRGSYGTGVRST
jgi:hypothetical protein